MNKTTRILLTIGIVLLILAVIPKMLLLLDLVMIPRRYHAIYLTGLAIFGVIAFLNWLSVMLFAMWKKK